MTNAEMTMHNLVNYMKEANDYNAVAQFIEGTYSMGLMYEVLDGNRRYFIKIIIDEKTEYMLFSVYPCIHVPKAYRTVVNEYLLCLNENRKVGFASLDMNYGDVYFHTETSFKNAPVSGDIVEENEKNALFFLTLHADDIETLAGGHFLNKNSSSLTVEHILDRMHSRDSNGIYSNSTGKCGVYDEYSNEIDNMMPSFNEEDDEDDPDQAL